MSRLHPKRIVLAQIQPGQTWVSNRIKHSKKSSSADDVGESQASPRAESTQHTPTVPLVPEHLTQRSETFELASLLLKP